MADLPDSISITWHIEDVKQIDPKLTDDEAREILQNFANNHDGSMSAMWQDLDYHVNEFKEERDYNG